MKKFISFLMVIMLAISAILPFSTVADAKSKKIAIKSIKLSTSTYTYNGKARKPKITVKDANGSVIKSSNYRVTYSKGRKNVGTYKITVKAKSKKYTGSKSVTFKIIPKGTSITSLTAQVKGFTVSYKKNVSQVSGYQLRISEKNSMADALSCTIHSPVITIKTFINLPEDKTYYVQVRTYKTVKKKTYYSAWSTKESVTTQAATPKPVPAPIPKIPYDIYKKK